MIRRAWDEAERGTTLLKRLYKQLAGRLLRGGLTGVNERLDRIEQLATADRSMYAVWRGDLRTGCAVGLEGEPNPDATSRLRAELAYWVRTRDDPSAVLPGVTDLAESIGHWHEERLGQLAEALGQSSDDFDTWAQGQRAVEIGGGPRPLIGARSWKRAVAIDPLSEGYDAEGLSATTPGLVRLCAAGESPPLVAGEADLVVCENALDHVGDPVRLLESARRLAAHEGRLWLRVDLADEVDEIHLHAFDPQSLRSLLERTGWRIAWERVADATSRPQAHSEFVALCQRA